MILTLLGIIGIGLVWGWYLAAFIGHVHRPRKTVPALCSTSLAVSTYTFWYSDVIGLAALVISIPAALILHVIWRRELQKRYGPFRPEHLGVNV